MIDRFQNLDWGYYGPELMTAVGDTLYMVGWSFILGGILGLLVGLVLYITRPGGIFANRAVYLVTNFIVNLIRPIPFVILIAALQPLTIAVLGTGIERLYPQRHLSLAKEIVEHGGALVSELPLDCPPQASNFPRRNRIISGLSLGVLVVEASPSSGSLITARLAADQGREVYAIPGSIHHPGARGCHQLIRQGAALVESVEDVLQALRGWQRLAPLADEASKPPQTDHPLLRELLAASRSSEALAAALDQPLGQVLAQLTELEIEGQVSCDNGLWSVLMR